MCYWNIISHIKFSKWYILCTHWKIKFKTGISRDFVSTCGVKQGDVLRPILFNLYINSIVDDLEKAKTDPVIVGDV